MEQEAEEIQPREIPPHRRGTGNSEQVLRSRFFQKPQALHVRRCTKLPGSHLGQQDVLRAALSGIEGLCQGQGQVVEDLSLSEARTHRHFREGRNVQGPAVFAGCGGNSQKKKADQFPGLVFRQAQFAGLQKALREKRHQEGGPLRSLFFEGLK